MPKKVFPPLAGKKGVVIGTDAISESLNKGELMFGFDFGTMGTSAEAAQLG